MPLPYMNFPIIKSDYSGIGNLLQNYFKGYELGQTPQRLEQEKQLREQEMLSNQLQQQLFGKQLEYYGPLKASEIAKNRRQALTGGFSGTAKNLAELHYLKEQEKNNPGSVDPQLIQSIENQLNFELEHEKVRKNYLQQTSDTYMYRNATPIEKIMMSIDALGKNQTYDQQGKLINLTPAEALNRINILNREAANRVTDQPTRQKLENMNAFATTLANVDPKKAFKYVGGLGHVAKKWQQTKGQLSGKDLTAYNEYVQNVARLKFGGEQLRNAFGMASAEAIEEKIQQLLNPDFVMNNPESAEAQYNAIVDLFNQEHRQLLQMQISPGAYGLNITPTGNVLGNQIYNNLATPESNQAMSPPTGKTVKRIYKGVPVNIPEHLVEQFDRENKNG